MADNVIPLQPGARRLGQTESADLYATLAAVPCPDCEAAIGDPCRRPAADGRLYETRLLHPRRIAAAQKAAEGRHG